MKLYQDNGNFSPNAKRVRVAAYEAGEPLDFVMLDFMKGDVRKPEFLAKNPNGKVPTIEDGNYVLWESPAILFHIASKHPAKKLAPTDARGTTEMLRWLFWNASHLERAVGTVAFERLMKPMMNLQTDEGRVADATKDWERFAPILNGQLEGKNWVLGGDLTIVDIAIGTSVEFAAMAGLDVKKHTHLSSWFNRLTERDAWKKASAK